jgi:hypothetical protein
MLGETLQLKHSTWTVLCEAVLEATDSAYSIIKKVMSELLYN